MFYSTCAFLGIAVGLFCFGAGVATAPRDGWVITMLASSIVFAMGLINLGIFVVTELVSKFK